MKKLSAFLLVLMCLQTMAQKPIIVRPTQIPTGNPVINTNTVPVNTTPATQAPVVQQMPPAQLEEQRKKAEMMRKVNRAKECADCLERLENTTITSVSVTFVGIPQSISNMEAAFGKKRIDLYTKDGSFNLNASFTGNPVRKEYRDTKDNKNGSYQILGYYFDETYTVIPTKTTTNKNMDDTELYCDILLMGLKESDFSCKRIELVFHYSIHNSYIKSATVKGIATSKKGIDINISQSMNGKILYYPSSWGFCYTSCY